MKVRFRRSYLIAMILASLLAYGYFSKPGEQDPVGAPPAAPVTVTGASSIQGPYFSDRDRIADRIVSAINHTRHTLDIAVYSFTQPEIATAIQTAHKRGVRVRIVTDEEQSFDRHSEIGYLKSIGIPVRLSGGFRGQRSLMHNKFAVFDEHVVETGSYNWTISATSYNFENAIFVRDSKISESYEREFKHIWAQAR